MKLPEPMKYLTITYVDLVGKQQQIKGYCTCGIADNWGWYTTNGMKIAPEGFGKVIRWGTNE